ncbi:MAG TPA: hypothetical protein VG095_09000 [Chthoniobacterales bacterium]|nr:hypothetical protein [Chthoniobacterales bacterium]
MHPVGDGDVGGVAQLQKCEQTFRMKLSRTFLALAVVLATASGRLVHAADEKGASGTTEGIFVGVEKGDYTHFLIKNKQGKQESFIVLKENKSMEPWLNTPTAVKARRLRVHWKMQNIPEAGGKVKTVVKVDERTTD